MANQKRAETAFDDSVDYIDAVSLNDLLDSSPPEKDNVYDMALGGLPVFNSSVDYLDTRPEKQQPLNMLTRWTIQSGSDVDLLPFTSI